MKPILRLGPVIFLLGLSVIAVANPQNNPKKPLSVSLPGKPWALQIDALGFDVKANEMQAGGQKYLMAENDKTNMVLSVTLEKIDGKATVDDCRRTLQERAKSDSQLKITNVETRDANGVPVLEYLIPEASGIPLRQRNFFACMVRDDVYVDLHLSKVLYQPQDEKLFTAILDATHFDPPAASESSNNTADVRQLFMDGSRAFMQGNYAGAIGSYQQALDLQKKQGVLDQTMSRVLIDNLGTAYGISGNLDKARETFDYGVSKDPTYPMFYYNIACVYGEKKDLENAITYLQKAFANKANVISGEKIPDPRMDDSFASFKDNDRFVKAMNSLLGAGQ